MKNYREQPELKCCENCKNANIHYDYCGCDLTKEELGYDTEVLFTGICDDFEMIKNN